MSLVSIHDDLAEWLRFLTSQSHVLREYPGLLLQQAANQPKQSGLSAPANELLSSGAGPWLRWINSPKQFSPCLLVLVGHTAAVNAIAITPDSRRIISCSDDKTIKIWESVSGEELQSLTGHSAGVTAVLVTPDGKRIVSGSADWTLKIWDPENALEENTLIGHKGEVSSIRLSTDGEYLISKSVDGTSRVWDLQTGRPVEGSTAHASSKSTAVPSGSGAREVRTADSRYILSIDENNLAVKDGTDSRNICSLSGHTDLIQSVAVSPDGTFIVTASKDQTLRIWEARRFAVLGSLAQQQGSSSPSDLQKRAHRKAVKALALFPDARRAYSLAENLCLWNLSGTQEPQSVEVDRECSSIALTPDSRYILATGEKLELFDAQNGKRLICIPSHHTIYSIAVTTDNNKAITVGTDNALRVWSIPQGVLIRTTRVEHGPISLILTSPDGRFAISAGGPSSFIGLPVVSSMGVSDEMAGSEDKSINVFAQDGKFLFALDGHSDRVIAAVVTPDGRSLISGSRDHTIAIWDLDSRTRTRSLKGHSATVDALIISPDSRFLVSAGSDSLRVWDLRQFQELLCLNNAAGHSLHCLTSDSCSILTAQGHVLHVWDSGSGCISQRFPAEAPIKTVTTLDDLIVVGDSIGHVYLLNRCGVEIGSRIVTARTVSQRSEIMCPYCLTTQDIVRENLDKQVNCTVCLKPLRLSPVLLPRSAKVWWRVWQ